MRVANRVARLLTGRTTDDGKNGGIFIAAINTFLRLLRSWSREKYIPYDFFIYFSSSFSSFSLSSHSTK